MAARAQVWDCLWGGGPHFSNPGGGSQEVKAPCRQFLKNWVISTYSTMVHVPCIN